MERAVIKDTLGLPQTHVFKKRELVKHRSAILNIFKKPEEPLLEQAKPA